jgi:hypothetical protein
MAFSNCWSDVLRANWATLSCFVDFRTGTYADLSSYARAMTLNVAAPPEQWENLTRGRGLDMAGTAAAAGYLSTPSAAALNLSPSGTIVAFPRSERRFVQNARLAWKRNIGVSCAYDWYDSAVTGSAAGAMGIYDGTTAHVLGAIPWATARSLATVFTVGSPPTGFVNGVRLAPPATLWAPQVDVSAVNLPGPAASGAPGVGWLCFLLFAAALTNAEIMQLHADFAWSGYAL